ncbi:phage baseplate assembly protein V [Gulbenkiania mobilis]|uniref:Phage baseplate assembly protein V n=1 Tax=Gulbenkiania mobilis TaxID=397457 RepID=A0ABY2CWM3_GULMO|nr:phage baseplate assembly protein V [Gulbenkiania mobilis]
MSETREESTPTLRFGFVTALDEAGCRVRVQFPDLDGLESYWLHVPHPKTHRDKHYCLPDVGEQVACLLDGAGEEGVVLGAIYSERDPAPVASVDKHHVVFDDGTLIDYDRASHKLFIHCVGDIEIVSDTHIIMRAPRIDLN